MTLDSKSDIHSDIHVFSYPTYNEWEPGLLNSAFFFQFHQFNLLLLLKCYEVS